ncbi:SDR family oxidoreductase [Limoniibacter endophyticus]|uniref:Short chain dehydrogenase n=1 Tax=Limoniibacter endophyticus TaxID=1565040 RepID=A0A8J3DGR5_9HYPH|nr:SDR family oxidoreductase [Limoniibacter endophyticus]GHC68706.1 short chain dehydrogenase [Limoniibacter endophyticus]
MKKPAISINHESDSQKQPVSKIALITGGARRVGRAIAQDLAQNGFSVAIHHHDSQEDAESIAEIARSFGVQAATVSGDLSDRSQYERIIAETVGKLGTLDILVNNASVFENDSVLDFDWPQWDAHFRLHVDAPVALTRAFHDQLPEDRKGLVVNLIDQRVWKITPTHFSYMLSKQALWAATRTMAQALAPRIRVNAIGPGPTLANSRQSQQHFLNQTDALILKHGPQLSEFGATIRYFWNSPSITGQMIALDGGQHLAWETPDVLVDE